MKIVGRCEQPKSESIQNWICTGRHCRMTNSELVDHFEDHGREAKRSEGWIFNFSATNNTPTHSTKFLTEYQ